MIRRNFLTDATTAQQYIDGVTRLKDPGQFPWPGQAGLSMYDVFVFWHHQSMMLMTPPGQNDRNAAHSGPARRTFPPFAEERHTAALHVSGDERVVRG